MKVERRRFLGTIVAGAAALKLAERASAAAPVRTYTAGKFALELDGAVACWLQSVKGGDARGDVVVESHGVSSYPKKHLAQISYADIEMSLALPMAPSLVDWIEATLEGSLDCRDGAIVAVDAQYKELWRREFTSALITEVQFPALDGASKDSAFLTVKIAAGVYEQGEGKRREARLQNGFEEVAQFEFSTGARQSRLLAGDEGRFAGDQETDGGRRAR